MKLLTAAAIVVLACSCARDPADVRGDGGGRLEFAGLVRPEQVKWKDGPESLPAGAKFAVLEGDPAKAGYFAMRVMLPAGYRIPPHWHPNVERVTVLSGTMLLGMGDSSDTGATEALPAGSYVSMPPRMRHFARTEVPTVVQITTTGPWAIHYLNQADDPRRGGK